MRIKSSTALLLLGIIIWLGAAIFSLYEKEWRMVLIATVLLPVSAIWKNKKRNPRSFL